MNRTPVDSSSIESMGYSQSEQELEVEFKDGDIYLYQNVPQSTFDQLINARSVGSAFHQLIRNGGFSFNKI